MQLIVLVADLSRATRRGKGIVVIENAKIRASFRPDVIGFRRVNVGIRPARCSQNAAIVRGKRSLLADIDLAAIHDGSRGPVYKTVDERRSRVLKDLLNPA